MDDSYYNLVSSSDVSHKGVHKAVMVETYLRLGVHIYSLSLNLQHALLLVSYQLSIIYNHAFQQQDHCSFVACRGGMCCTSPILACSP
jgi:hypothetical protein